AGGESAEGVGFLTVCDAAHGTVLLSEQHLNGRVNQLTFTDDGTLLLAALPNGVRLYKLQTNGTFAFRSAATIDPQFDCVSAVIAGGGSTVWLAAINYNTTPFTGLV